MKRFTLVSMVLIAVSGQNRIASCSGIHLQSSVQHLVDLNQKLTRVVAIDYVISGCIRGNLCVGERQQSHRFRGSQLFDDAAQKCTVLGSYICSVNQDEIRRIKDCLDDCLSRSSRRRNGRTTTFKQLPPRLKQRSIIVDDQHFRRRGLFTRHKPPLSCKVS